MKSKTKIFWSLAALVLVIAVAIRWESKNKNVAVPTVLKHFSKNSNPVPAPTLNEAIDGELVDPAVAQKRPIAVMIENHPDARPQAGLVNADLVYETLAEGGITRFMAIYQTRNAPNIGPVRSARTYFATLADELGAVYAHVGGNSDVLANIRAGDYKNTSDADQFFNDPFFHRITARPMPHNVYTSTDKLNGLITSHKFPDTATFSPWKFKDDNSATATATTIKVNFSFPEYAVRWQYNAIKNQYLRFMAGLPHKDADTGKQIIAKNIIVQSVNIFPVQSDTPLSIGMNLDEGGHAVIFLDGKVIQGTWVKKDGRTRYYDGSGSEISFNRGSIWVEIVPAEQFANLSWQ